MADLGEMTLNTRLRDLQTNREHVTYTDAANNAVWNFGSMVIPSDIEHAILRGAVFYSTGAATKHVVDDTALRESVALMLRRDASDAYQRRWFISDPIAGVDLGAAGGATPDNWVARFPELYAYVTGGDRIQYIAPPADDNGAPTGDYVCTLELEVGTYYKS